MWLFFLLRAAHVYRFVIHVGAGRFGPAEKVWWHQRMQPSASGTITWREPSLWSSSSWCVAPCLTWWCTCDTSTSDTLLPGWCSILYFGSNFVWILSCTWLSAASTALRVLTLYVGCCCPSVCHCGSSPPTPPLYRAMFIPHLGKKQSQMQRTPSVTMNQDQQAVTSNQTWILKYKEMAQRERTTTTTDTMTHQLHMEHRSYSQGHTFRDISEIFLGVRGRTLPYLSYWINTVVWNVVHI